MPRERPQPRHRLGTCATASSNSPSIKIVLARTFAHRLVGRLFSVSALMSALWRSTLLTRRADYGSMLGAFGMGAVFGALNIGQIRRQLRAKPRSPPVRCRWAAPLSRWGLSRMPVLTRRRW